MSVFTEVLPATKSSAHRAVRWVPAGADGFVVGAVTIDTERAGATYTVSEFSTGWVDRGFVLAKAGGGGSYTVYCNPARPAAASCDCKGHARHLHCKHADAVVALIGNGWL